jgi:hypothetical protein
MQRRSLLKPTEPRRAGGALVGDRRGAVIVMAVFMSIFLVGCLWYLIGIGDAALYRARLDAAADAVAYGAAVYHARGMNLVAMLNLILAATLAIAIVSKALKFVIGIVYETTKFVCYVAKIAGGTDPACGIASDAAERMAKLNDIIDKVEESNSGLIASISTAQREVAEVTAWVAATESTNLAKDYEPIAVGGGAVSPSMAKLNGRHGLPVMDEEFPITCQRGTELAPTMITELIPPVYLQYVALTGSLAGLANDFSAEYCGDATFTGGDFNIFNEKDVCEEKQSKHSKYDDDDDKGGGKDDKFDYDKCVKENKVDPAKMDQTMKEENIKHEDPTKGLEPVEEPQSKTAKKLVPYAVNGNEWFQVYALVLGDTTRLRAPDKGVLIASGGGTIPGQEGLEKYGFAQAEFFYDQTPQAGAEDVYQKPGTGLAFADYRDNALWNMRWRARLRLYRVPTYVDVNVLNGVPGNSNIDPDYVPDTLMDVIEGAATQGLATKLMQFKMNLSQLINQGP